MTRLPIRARWQYGDPLTCAAPAILKRRTARRRVSGAYHAPGRIHFPADANAQYTSERVRLQGFFRGIANSRAAAQGACERGPEGDCLPYRSYMYGSPMSAFSLSYMKWVLGFFVRSSGMG